MKVFVIIQARMGSSRLPGKVLKMINGKPALWYIVKRLEILPNSKLIVATSELPQDDQIAEFVNQQANLELFRGSHTDLVSRYFQCIMSIVDHSSSDIVVRVCADNFMICPSIVSASIKLLSLNKSIDIVNPFLNSNLPFGCGAEVSTVSVIQKLYQKTRNGPSNFREHLFFYAYNNPEYFSTSSLQDPMWDKECNINISVDTSSDFDYIKAKMEKLGVSGCIHADVDDIINEF
jgi:spore coat polysaccharide biosynthesis protein SpsF